MLNRIVLSALLVSVTSIGFAKGVGCHTSPDQEDFLTEKYNYKVAGTGRLYFYNGPDEKCLDKKVFVIPGDSLVAYAEYGKHEEWSNVGFTTKDGDEITGWVKTERLMFTGAFGMNMTPEKVQYYQKAAKAAKAGKLGAP